MKKTFLFFPIDVGLAHLIRPISIAEELTKRGHRCIIAMPKRKQHLFKRCKAEFVTISAYIDDDFKIDVASFSNYEFFKGLVEEELKLIREYKPDTVIVDFRLSALAACTIAGVKFYALTNSDGLPYGCRLPNTGLPSILHSMVVPVVHKVFDIRTRQYMKPLFAVMKEYGKDVNFDDWFKTFEILVPEQPFYMPPVAKDLNIHYVSPLVWYDFDITVPDWLHTIEPNGKTVYVSFGGTGFDKKKPVEIAIKLVELGFRVIVTTAHICSPKDFPQMDNLFVTQFLPGNEVVKRVDLVICHGGHGTTTDAVMHGVSAVLIPFNPDQILHANRMEELGVAKCLFKMNFQDIVNVFTLNWRAIENKGKNISVETVVSAARDVLEHKNRYDDAIKAFQAGYKHKTGMEEVADIVCTK